MKNTIENLVKISFCFFIVLILSFTLISNKTSAHSVDEHLFSKIYTFGNIEDRKTRINVSNINGNNIIFLPSTVSPDSLILFTDFSNEGSVRIRGEKKETIFSNVVKIDLNQYCSEGNYLLDFIFTQNGSTFEEKIRFVFSKNISPLYLISDNPEEYGRKWVESSPEKKNKAKGHIVIQNPNGEYIYNGSLTQIKGRGNSTWKSAKKPYQIKTEKKVDLLDSNDDNNSSKTWVLLANYVDPSLLRNTISLNLGKALGLEKNIQCTPVDLYYDGEYRGSYLLTEKVEIGNGRVDIVDLEGKNEEINKPNDIESYPIATSVTDNGAIFTFCEGMKSPEDISGGYLLEMDYPDRALEEICYFKTTRGQHIVVKSPEYASKEEMEYISALYQEYEDAVYNDGVNPHTGKRYSDYVDAESTAIYYLVNEFSKTKDFFNSSAYLYKNAGEEKLYMGPLWDFDSGYGISRTADANRDSADGLSEYNTEFSIKLLSIEDFYKTTQDLYNTKFRYLVNDVLLGDDQSSSDAGNLNSISYESSHIKASAENNSILWYDKTPDNINEAKILSLYIKERINTMDILFNPEFKSIPDSELEFLKRTYKDVPKDSWFYSVIENVTTQKYMNGTGNGFFEPYAKVKRSEVAQGIYNIYNATHNGKFKKLFDDVAESDWYSEAVTWAVNSNIMKGYSDGTFHPDNFVTREEIIYYLYKAKKARPLNTSLIKNFTDHISVSNFAKDAMEWAINEKIIIGDDMNRINPSGYITRAEFAAILVRLI